MNKMLCKKLDEGHIQLGDFIVGWDTLMRFPQVEVLDDMVQLSWTCGAHIWVNSTEIVDIAFPGDCQEGSFEVYLKTGKTTKILIGEGCHKGTWKATFPYVLPPKKKPRIIKEVPSYLLLGHLHELGYNFGNIAERGTQ